MTRPDGTTLLVRDVERLPRERDGRIDVARTHAALAPADLLESAPSAGWNYVVPDLGAAGHPDLLRLVDDGATTHADHADGRREELGTDPLHALDVVSERHGVHPDAIRPAGLPALTGGLVGAFAYDLARRIARLPSVARSDRELPLLALRLVQEGEAGNALAEAQGRREGFGEALRQVAADLEAIHHRLDRVLAAQVELRRGVDLGDLAVDAHAHETLAAQLLEHLQVLALAILDHRRQQR